MDETPAEQNALGDDVEEIVDVDSDMEGEEVIQADNIIDDVSILNEDFSDINHFLGINFGMKNNFTLTDSASILKDSWFDVKLKLFLYNIKEMVLASSYKIASKNIAY